jgi:hypothetical protein
MGLLEFVAKVYPGLRRTSAYELYRVWSWPIRPVKTFAPVLLPDENSDMIDLVSAQDW